jgi:hypothetical protein
MTVMDDDELLVLLRDSLATERVLPARALAAAEAAISWLNPSQAVAAIMFDSADEPVLAGVRGDSHAARQVAYSVAGMSLELRIDAEAPDAAGAGGRARQRRVRPVRDRPAG